MRPLFKRSGFLGDLGNLLAWSPVYRADVDEPKCEICDSPPTCRVNQHAYCDRHIDLAFKRVAELVARAKGWDVDETVDDAELFLRWGDLDLPAEDDSEVPVD